MAESAEELRHEDEWRVEVHLQKDEHGHSFGKRLDDLHLDDEAQERLGDSIIVTRDGPRLFLYAWHERSAHEAEAMIRTLLEDDNLAASVELMRWHPVEEAWKPASEPLPETGEEHDQELARLEQAKRVEFAEKGDYDWQVVVHLPDVKSTYSFANKLEAEGDSVKRRWRYVIVGAVSEEDAKKRAAELQLEAPRESVVEVRANPKHLPTKAFVVMGNMEPNALRDRGI